LAEFLLRTTGMPFERRKVEKSGRLSFAKAESAAPAKARASAS
jgi:hypothetical protein